eukprot:CAMPEP_0113868418 /NCGR_PEP_ID=MMETSP0780_2-20120614/976_1 /TAXON_ID=652834 /ORGANISM="Palpitomonas bilix" /LENGTH=121 /DNA_ID=CAMNT_0000853495 /DNA_START=590 /DNA_END=952 /DNA_ORIENTATION=- /assembly_acc=CAM_ASM_000599
MTSTGSPSTLQGPLKRYSLRSSRDNAKSQTYDGEKAFDGHENRQSMGAQSLRSSLCLQEWVGRDEAELHKWSLTFNEEEEWVEYFFKRLRSTAKASLGVDHQRNCDIERAADFITRFAPVW